MLMQKAYTEAERLQRALSWQEKQVREVLERFVRDTTNSATLRKVREYLERGNVEAALKLADGNIVRASAIIPRVMTELGWEAFELTVRGMTIKPAVGVAFDATLPRAAELMRKNKLEFVQQLTRSQREATRAALTSALRHGRGPIAAARAFRDSIGLTRHQLEVVANYRRLLEEGSRQALERVLRDGRFDSTIENAIESDTPLTKKQIDRMVQRYRERTLKLRAETIARTETHRMLSAAQHEALLQTVEQLGIRPDDVTRVWNATEDERTRDSHEEMNGQERGLRERFETPSGERLLYPGDPAGSAGEVINCRCIVTVRIKERS